jgi:hypothetical protein
MKSLRHHGWASSDAAGHILADRNRGIREEAYRDYFVGARRHVVPTLGAGKKMSGENIREGFFPARLVRYNTDFLKGLPVSEAERTMSS